ncbi:hypothetical protein MTR_7g022910 [Medicago truncatula]|uniref:Uncharacterized protein n=1 Tax=Medicago truncatula TaxID=3880 RepID=G7KVP1_MEDTR|nr:hypothetical protein MTR_7g022910 [Medicago truncatula]
MHVLHYKLKSLKPKLRNWNKLVVGDLNNQLALAQHQLGEIQAAIDQLGISTDRNIEEIACLERWSKLENLRVTSLCLEVEEVFSTLQAIEEHVLSYFSKIFASPPNCVVNNLPQKLIPCLVSFEDNQFLTSLPSGSEIKNDVFHQLLRYQIGIKSLWFCSKGLSRSSITQFEGRNAEGNTMNGSSSFNTHLPILEARNWERWSTVMKNLFGAQDLLEIVQNGVGELVLNATDVQRNTHKELKKKDCKALFLIQQSLDEGN